MSRGDLLAGESRQVMKRAEECKARQRVWPADAGLDEARLRGELSGLVAESETLRHRALALLKTLPEPPHMELDGEVPESLYFALYDALSCFAEDVMVDARNYVEGRLGETPESLRRDWLRRKLDRLDGLAKSLAMQQPERESVRRQQLSEEEDPSSCPN